MTEWWCITLPGILTPSLDLIRNAIHEVYSCSYLRGIKFLSKKEIALEEAKRGGDLGGRQLRRVLNKGKPMAAGVSTLVSGASSLVSLIESLSKESNSYAQVIYVQSELIPALKVLATHINKARQAGHGSRSTCCDAGFWTYGVPLQTSQRNQE